jgi:hypothetical protein
VTRVVVLGERFVAIARGHHGYPYPDVDYVPHVYGCACRHCGIHGEQVAPFRVRRALGAPHSVFIQLNWVFDALFVRADAAMELRNSELSGFELGPVLLAQAGAEISSHRQLVIRTAIPCLETSRLPVVTCKKENEEAAYRLAGSAEAEQLALPHCGRIKHHPPTTVGLRSDNLVGAPDIFLADEWVGSGASAFRVVIVSKEFVDLVRRRHWRGLDFKQAIIGGYSERVT